MYRERPYQIDGLKACRSLMREGCRRFIVEWATGTGKGCLFGMIGKMTAAKGKKLLIVCNRDTLIRQAAEKVLKFSGIFPSVDKAEEKASVMAQIVVGSLQTLQGDRLTRWAHDHFDIILHDEAHGCTSKTWRNVLNHFPDCYHIGMTATVERHDKQGIGFWFEKIAHEYPLLSRTEYDSAGNVQRIVSGAINDGWLAPIKILQIPVPVTIDERLAASKHITEEQEAFALAPYLQKLAFAVVDQIKCRKSLIFCADCKTSEAMAQLLRDSGIEAQHVDSTYLNPSETERRLRWFKDSGRGSALVNASLLTTGFDQADIDAIVPLRLIRSTSLYRQIAGRGTRVVCNVDSCDTAEDRRLMIDMSAKPDCLVLDLMLQNEEHDFVSPACLVSTLKEENKSLIKKHGGFQKETDLSLLQAESDKQRLTDIEERLKKTAEAIANRHERKRAVTKDVFIGDILKRDGDGDIASEKQIGFMRSLGVKLDFGSVTKRQASRIIGRYLDHKKRQLEREEMLA